jgi:hypothetical protein
MHTHVPQQTNQALMLDYQAKWPLSLVVSRRAVTKYQLLFRHLFLAKFVERRLHTAWAEQQSTKVGGKTKTRAIVFYIVNE